MSTQIQQQQVQGLVDTVASLGTVSGNLNNTGQNLATNLLSTGINLQNTVIATGNALDAVDTALTGVITTNRNTILATGSFLDIEITTVSGLLALTGQTLTGTIVATGAAVSGFATAISGNLDYTSGKVDTVSGSVDFISGNLNYTSGKLDTATGNLSSTGVTLRDNLLSTGSTLDVKLGSNSLAAVNLGSGLSPPNNKIYGETSMVVNPTCCNRVIQFMGDISGSSVAGAGNTDLYVGGLRGQTAALPTDSQWYVKMYVNARSIEPGDQGPGFNGRYGLETGFLIDHESIGSPKCTLSTIIDGGGSGSAGDFAGKLDVILHASGTTIGYLAISGVNQYTGMVRFHATAYVSQLTGFQR
tara:strand:+ start:368 stop:1444 length:1077 start_codon:yes stop_codon:yes gene_type:complete